MVVKSDGNTLLQFIKGRWMMAVVSLYILSFSGATYIFGIYSGAIKKELHYNQEMIGTLGFFKDVGANVGIMSGVMKEVLPAGTILAVGALMNLFGYLMVWLAVTHRIARPPTWHMNLFICIGANSQSFANTGVLVTFIQNFPQGRGEVLGIIKGCVGLSGAIFTQIYHALYGQDTAGVILLIGWLPSLVTLIFMFFIRPIAPVYDKNEKRNIYSFLYLALLLAAFLMVAIIVQNQLNLPSFAYKVFGAITVILVVSTVAIGIWAENAFMAQVRECPPMKGNMLEDLCTTTMKQVEVKGAEKTDERPSDSHPNLNVKSSTHEPKFIIKLKLFFKTWPQRGEDFTILQALLSLDMWILFISLTCGLGAALSAVDNMGQIGESLGYSKLNVSTFVSLISIWNFLGRVIAGFVSEILLRRYRFPRTLMLTIVLGLACFGYLLIAYPARNTLYVASIIMGLCFGAQLPLLLAIISELFGLKYYATLSTVGGIASPLGSYLLSVRVAGHLYDREARRQNAGLLLKGRGGVGAPFPATMHGDITCMGPECFRLTFLIMMMVSALGCLVSSLLVLRTKKFYSQNIYAKFNVKPGIEENQNALFENGEMGTLPKPAPTF